jgi:hypothetical protein
VAARRIIVGHVAPEWPVAQSRSGPAFHAESSQNLAADLNRAQ